MISDRLIVLINWYGTSPRKKFTEFSEKTGLESKTLKNLFHKQQRVNEEHIDAICKAFPEYKHWLVFGETDPEKGQISPELEDVRKAY